MHVVQALLLLLWCLPHGGVSWTMPGTPIDPSPSPSADPYHQASGFTQLAGSVFSLLTSPYMTKQCVRAINIVLSKRASTSSPFLHVRERSAVFSSLDPATSKPFATITRFRDGTEFENDGSSAPGTWYDINVQANMTQLRVEVIAMAPKIPLTGILISNARIAVDISVFLPRSSTVGNFVVHVDHLSVFDFDIDGGTEPVPNAMSFEQKPQSPRLWLWIVSLWEFLCNMMSSLFAFTTPSSESPSVSLVKRRSAAVIKLALRHLGTLKRRLQKILFSAINGSRRGWLAIVRLMANAVETFLSGARSLRARILKPRVQRVGKALPMPTPSTITDQQRLDTLSAIIEMSNVTETARIRYEHRVASPGGTRTQPEAKLRDLNLSTHSLGALRDHWATFLEHAIHKFVLNPSVVESVLRSALPPDDNASWRLFAVGLAAVDIADESQLTVHMNETLGNDEYLTTIEYTIASRVPLSPAILFDCRMAYGFVTRQIGLQSAKVRFEGVRLKASMDDTDSWVDVVLDNPPSIRDLHVTPVGSIPTTLTAFLESAVFRLVPKSYRIMMSSIIPHLSEQLIGPDPVDIIEDLRDKIRSRLRVNNTR